MVTFDDVARIALELPGDRGDHLVRQHVLGREERRQRPRPKGFVWERPLSKKDRKLLTEAGEIEVPPDEVILAARVEDLAEKEAVLAEHADAVFTTPHFNGYPAVLVRLDRMDEALLREIVTSAWLAVAPKNLAAEFDAREYGGRLAARVAAGQCRSAPDVAGDTTTREVGMASGGGPGRQTSSSVAATSSPW